jgi:hypothetical protein
MCAKESQPYSYVNTFFVSVNKAINEDAILAAHEKAGLQFTQIFWEAPSEYRTKIQLAFNLASAGGQGTMTVYGSALSTRRSIEARLGPSRSGPREGAVAVSDALGME